MPRMIRAAGRHDRYRALAAAALLAGGSSGAVLALGAQQASAQTSASQADATALQYVQSHYPGSCAGRVLRTEADVEKGVPVYDIRTVAPSGTVYVVHIQRSNDAVVSVNRAESQPGGCGSVSPGQPGPVPGSGESEQPRSDRHETGSDRHGESPDRHGKSPDRHGRSPDRHDNSGSDQRDAAGTSASDR